jgi:hypothetical protein
MSPAELGFQDFLAQQSAAGAYDSQGAFTMDFAEAAERLATFRLPSENHYLLKVVQVASRLGSDVVRVKMENFRTSIHFRAPSGDGVNDSEAIARAFLAPLEVEVPILADLAAALWGCLGDTTEEILWSFSQGYQGRRFFIRDRTFRSEDFVIDKPMEEGEPPCAFTLSVLHKKTWRFWLYSRRNASAYKLLIDNCGLSRVGISVDGREMERAPGSYFAKHRRLETAFTDAPANCRPYHIALYELTERAGFEIQRPSLSQYVVREKHVNVWASATRLHNTLKPDGVSTPSWMLQFRKDNENLSMRAVPKRARCRILLAYDPRGATVGEPLRLTLVRQSVLMDTASLHDVLAGLVKWCGCHLILDDDGLRTDLTGFQVIEDGRLLELLESLQPKLDLARSYLEQWRHLASGL